MKYVVMIENDYIYGNYCIDIHGVPNNWIIQYSKRLVATGALVTIYILNTSASMHIIFEFT